MTRDAVARAVDRVLTEREVTEALAIPISATEREETVELIRWFTTRYPTAEARLAYVRQAYARWQRRTVR
jgi:hypothetical protein